MAKLLVFLADVSSKPKELDHEVANRRRDMEKQLEILSLLHPSQCLKCMDETLSTAPEEACGTLKSPEEAYDISRSRPWRILRCESFAVRL